LCYYVQYVLRARAWIPLLGMPVRLPICVACSALYGTVAQLELRNLFVTKPIIDEHRKHIEIIFRHLSRRLLLRSFRIQEVKNSLLGELSGDPTQNIVCVCVLHCLLCTKSHLLQYLLHLSCLLASSWFLGLFTKTFSASLVSLIYLEGWGGLLKVSVLEGTAEKF